MPFKKRNKQTATMKRATKKRLMEISICVDNYIYKNRPINLEEAKTLAYEISLYQSQYNNDTHILQVTEKLTRFMKRIIEESTKISSPNEKLNESHKVSIDLFSECSVNNEHNNHNKIIESSNLETNVETETKNKQNRPAVSEGIVISDYENNERGNKNRATLSVSYKCPDFLSVGKFKLNKLEKNDEHKFGNFNRHEVARTLTCIEINRKDVLTTEITPLNKENVQHSIPNTINGKLIKPDLFHIRKNVFKNNKVVNHSHELTLGNKETLVKSTRQLLKDSLSHARIKDTHKKTSPEITHTLMQNLNSKKLKKDKIVKTKTSKKLKTNSNTSRKPELKQTRNKNSKTRNKTVQNEIMENTASTPFFVQQPCSTSKTKQKQIDIISNEVSLHMKSAGNDTLRTESPNPDVISKQMSALKIYNECVVNDLSWIEDIRYVREINVTEFELTPNRYPETFWDTFTLPNGWSDVEFID